MPKYTFHARAIEAKDVPQTDDNGKSDPYLVFYLGEKKKYKTKYIPETLTPRWDEQFNFEVDNTDTLTIELVDADNGKDDKVGVIDLNLTSYQVGQVIDSWFTCQPKGKARRGAQVHLMFQMAPAGHPAFQPVAGIHPQPVAPPPSYVPPAPAPTYVPPAPAPSYPPPGAPGYPPPGAPGYPPPGAPGYPPPGAPGYPPPGAPGYPPPGAPGYPPPGYPPQGPPGYPPQGPPGYPPQGPPGYPPQGPPGYPPQGPPGYPSQGPPGYPPQGPPGYPPQGPPGYPPQGAPGYPPQGAPGYPPQGGPVQMCLHVKAIEAKDVPKMDAGGKSDPYLTLKCGAQEYRTKVIDNTITPVWNEIFSWQILDQSESLQITMWDKDIAKDDKIGQLNVELREFKPGQVIDTWFTLNPAQSGKRGGSVHILIQIAPMGAPRFQ